MKQRCILFSRLHSLQRKAEQVGVQQVVGNLRSALSLRIAEKVAQNQYDRLGELAHENPFDWLQEYNTLPGNYEGKQKVVNVEQLSPGSWAYESSSRDLIYRVQANNDLHYEFNGPPQLRFRVFFQFSAKNINGIADSNRNYVSSAKLLPVKPYHWGNQ